MQVFNAKTQQVEDVKWSVDANNEVVATFADGTFLKFPSGTNENDLKAAVEAHQAANEGQEVITPEQEAAAAEQRQANEDLVAKLNGDTTPEGEQSNATESSEPADGEQSADAGESA